MDNCWYIFAYDLGERGHKDVTTVNNNAGFYAFSNINKEIEKIEWMDNKESLDFIIRNGSLIVNLTGTPYGVNYCVRVAKAYLK